MEEHALIRCAATSAIPLGNSIALYHSEKSSGELLPMSVARLLLECQDFKLPLTHARDAWSKLSLRERLATGKDIATRYSEIEPGALLLGSQAFERMLARIIEHLYAKGLFLALEDLLSFSKGPVVHRTDVLASTPVSSSTERSAPLSLVGFVSRNRPDTLLKSVTSYLHHAEVFAREITVTVIDSSLDPAVNMRYRSGLTALGNQHRARVLYADLSATRRFADYLIKKGIPPDVINFSLFGHPKRLPVPTVVTGATRNALLLQSSGNLLLSSDDDVNCNVRVLPESSSELRIGKAGKPAFVFRTFPTRQEALSATLPSSTNLFELHERYLGKNIAHSIADASTDRTLVLENVDLRAFSKIRRHRDRIVLSFNGIVGDCGSAQSPLPGFWIGQFDPKEEIDKARYRNFFVSREVCKCPKYVNITPAYQCMTTVFGADNRELLPPFLPLFRNQDALFGRVLSGCATDEYFAELPVMLPHEPPEQRAFPCTGARVEAVGLADAIINCVDSFAGSHLELAFEHKLTALGKHLIDHGNAPPEEFWNNLCELTFVRRALTISAYEKLLNENRRAPHVWRDDMQKQLAVYQEHFFDAPHYVSDTFAHSQGSVDARQFVQHSVRRYGELLTWWPAIVRATAELRAAGVSLAEELPRTDEGYPVARLTARRQSPVTNGSRDARSVGTQVELVVALDK